MRVEPYEHPPDRQARELAELDIVSKAFQVLTANAALAIVYLASNGVEISGTVTPRQVIERINFTNIDVASLTSAAYLAASLGSVVAAAVSLGTLLHPLADPLLTLRTAGGLLGLATLWLVGNVGVSAWEGGLTGWGTVLFVGAIALAGLFTFYPRLKERAHRRRTERAAKAAATPGG
jgi:hypothetical protein